MNFIFLGTGYVLSHLISSFLKKNEVKYYSSTRQSKNNEIGPHSFYFDLLKETSWVNIPNITGVVIWSIPTLSLSFDDEKSLLESFSKWLVVHRQGVDHLIYISSTSVYPQTSGSYSEVYEIDEQLILEKGKKRITTEKIFQKNLKTTVIRPGGIYGADRNVALTFLNGFSIPRGLGYKTIGRIHVTDLSRIIIMIAERKIDAPIVNAIDKKPSSSFEFIHFCLSDSYFEEQKEFFQNLLGNDSKTSKSVFESSNRVIVSEALANAPFQYRYPSYNEAMTEIIDYIKNKYSKNDIALLTKGKSL